MGIDFNNLIHNLGQSVAKFTKDKEKIDAKSELNAYVSGWDAIKAKAEAENAKNEPQEYGKVDIEALEGEMKFELASLMGADFGKAAQVKENDKKDAEGEPFFSDDDISLENMMSLLSTDDGLDIDKLREENKKPMLSTPDESVAMEEMRKFGFDSELTDILLEETPGAIKYITDAIKSGSAKRIADNVNKSEKDEQGARNILEAMFEQAREEIRLANLEKREENFEGTNTLNETYRNLYEQQQNEFLKPLETKENELELEKNSKDINGLQ